MGPRGEKLEKEGTEEKEEEWRLEKGWRWERGRGMAGMHIGLKDDEIDAQNTKPFAPPFACSLPPLTHSLAPHCLLCSRARLPSFVCSPPLAYSGAHGKEVFVDEWNALISCSFSPLWHGVVKKGMNIERN